MQLLAPTTLKKNEAARKSNFMLDGMCVGERREMNFILRHPASSFPEKLSCDPFH